MTIYLFQKGSSESKTPHKIETVDVIPENIPPSQEVPAAVRRGGFVLKIYQNSLSIAFFLLFAAFSFMHADGAKQYNKEQVEHRQPIVTTVEFMKTSQLRFESFQN